MTAVPVPQSPRDRKRLLAGCTIISVGSLFLTSFFEDNTTITAILLAVTLASALYARVIIGSNEEDSK